MTSYFIEKLYFLILILIIKHFYITYLLREYEVKNIQTLFTSLVFSEVVCISIGCLNSFKFVVLSLPLC